MDVEQRAREMNMAMTVEEVAKIISGAPFPSRKSLEKARTVIEYMSNRAALTPPEGYVLVPVEPTEAMIEASYGHYGPGAYEAMLAARPEVKP